LFYALTSEQKAVANGYIDGLENYFSKPQRLTATSSEYRTNLNGLINYLKSIGIESDILTQVTSTIANNLSAHNNSYGVYYDIINEAMNDFKDALTVERLAEYEDMLDSIQDDPLVLLQTKAKEEQRMVYAVAWVILLFQTFAILFMYAKRLVVTILLVCLFPVVMAMYVIDKMGDGRSQSLESWFKEFIANTTIQFFHGVVYIIVVNLGIDAVRANPDKNWFILLIAVCSLFPVERILRDILGMQASTIGQLRFSGAGAIAAGAAMFATGRNAVRLGRSGAGAISSGVKNFSAGFKNARSGGASVMGAVKQQVKQGALNAKDKLKAATLNAWDQAHEPTARQKRRSDLQEAKKRNRALLQQRAENGGGAIIKARAGLSKIGDKMDNVKDRIKGAPGIRQALKFSGEAAAIGRFAGKPLKAVGGFYKKTAGVALGATNLVDGVASGSGIGQAVSTARSTAHNVGGFKNQQKPKAKAVDNTKNKYNSHYKPISYGDENASTGGNSSPIFSDQEEALLGAGAIAGGFALKGISDSRRDEREAEEREARESEENAQAQAQAEAEAEKNPPTIEGTADTTVEAGSGEGEVVVTGTSSITAKGDLSGVEEIVTHDETTVSEESGGGIKVEGSSEVGAVDTSDSIHSTDITGEVKKAEETSGSTEEEHRI
jgi:hypothetical protein